MLFGPFYPSYRPIWSTLINFRSQPLESPLWYLSSEIRWPPKVKIRCFALSFANQTGWIESYKYKYNFTTQWNWAWLGILSEPLEIKRLNRSPFDYRQKYKNGNVLNVKIDCCINRGFGVTLLITWPQWRHIIWKMNGLNIVSEIYG